MLTLHEAAKRLNVHPNTLTRYIKLGLIPGYKLGGTQNNKRHWMIKEEDLETFAQGEL